jgi:hypothetical protein
VVDGMLRISVSMFLLPSVARCAEILMIRIDRARVLIAIIGMQVSGMCSYVNAICYVHALTMMIEKYFLMQAAGQDCRRYTDISDGWSPVFVDSIIQSCCSLCGNNHDELRGCPCPRCLCWHPDSDCFQFVVEMPAMNLDAPCSRYGPCLSIVAF